MYCVVCMYVCVPVVVCTHDDVRSVTSRAIVHRPPARPLDRSIVCVVYACVTRLVLRFTNSMLRALPVTLPFRLATPPGFGRYTRPEGEPCTYISLGSIYMIRANHFFFVFIFAWFWYDPPPRPPSPSPIHVFIHRCRRFGCFRYFRFFSDSPDQARVSIVNTCF